VFPSPGIRRLHCRPQFGRWAGAARERGGRGGEGRSNGSGLIGGALGGNSDGQGKNQGLIKSLKGKGHEPEVRRPIPNNHQSPIGRYP
jgi:hypothetical protein